MRLPARRSWRQFRQRLRIAIDGEDRRPFLEEAFGNGATDARGGSTDDRDLAVETFVHARPSRWRCDSRKASNDMRPFNKDVIDEHRNGAARHRPSMR